MQTLTLASYIHRANLMCMLKTLHRVQENIFHYIVLVRDYSQHRLYNIHKVYHITLT